MRAISDVPRQMTAVDADVFIDSSSASIDVNIQAHMLTFTEDAAVGAATAS